MFGTKLRSRPLMLLAVLVLAAPSGGCAASTPEVAMAHAGEEVSSLSYALRVGSGQGTMVQATADAVRTSLITAGFRLGEESSADVILELDVTDIESKSFMVIVVNGKQQTKRAVTATLRAVSGSGKTLDQHVEKFTVSQDEEVPASKLAPLINHFAKSAELERFSLEVQIARVKGGSSPTEPNDEQPGDAAGRPGASATQGKSKKKPDANSPTRGDASAEADDAYAK